MVILWTIIVVLTPAAPPAEVFEALCLKTGGHEIRINSGTIRDEQTGMVYRTMTIHCLPEKKVKA